MGLDPSRDGSYLNDTFGRPDLTFRRRWDEDLSSAKNPVYKQFRSRSSDCGTRSQDSELNVWQGLFWGDSAVSG